MNQSVKKCLTFLLLLCAVFACSLAGAYADDRVPVFWQLTAVEQDASSDYAYGTGSASVSTDAVRSDRVEEMTDAARATHSVLLSASRQTKEGPLDAKAVYTLSGAPVVVPGAGRAQLTITAETTGDDRLFYFYGIVRADSKYIVRVRRTGSWVFCVSFPRTAKEGDSHGFAIMQDGSSKLVTLKPADGIQQVATTVPYDPTSLFMASALMEINKKLDAIQETQQEMFNQCVHA